MTKSTQLDLRFNKNFLAFFHFVCKFDLMKEDGVWSSHFNKKLNYSIILEAQSSYSWNTCHGELHNKILREWITSTPYCYIKPCKALEICRIFLICNMFQNILTNNSYANGSCGWRLWVIDMFCWSDWWYYHRGTFMRRGCCSFIFLVIVTTFHLNWMLSQRCCLFSSSQSIGNYVRLKWWSNLQSTKYRLRALSSQNSLLNI